MPDQHEPGGNQGDPSKDQPAFKPEAGANNTDPVVKREGASERTTEQAAKPKPPINIESPKTSEGPKWTDRAIVFLTGAIVLLAYMQWREMHSAGDQTDKLINAAKISANAAGDSADAAQQFADTAEDINGHLDDAVDRLETQAKAIEEARESSIAASSKSLNQSISASRLDQRAWLGVSDLIMPSIPGAEKQFPVTIILANSGKTPATQVEKSSGYRYSTVPITGPSAMDISKLTFSPMQSVAPQGKATMVLGYVSASGDLSSTSDLAGNADIATHFQDIQDGKLILYYFGTIKYEDAFGNQRTTNYCIYIADTKQKIIGFCQYFNDLN